MKTPKCPFCDSDVVVRAGARKLRNNGRRQMFRCNDCMKRFSSMNRTGKRTEGRALLQSLILRCHGYMLAEIAHVLSRKYRLARARSTLSRWVSEYSPPYLEIASGIVAPKGPLVRSWLFTHRKLNYVYQLHMGKLRFAEKFGHLCEYLKTLADRLDHGLFESARHCSGMKLVPNPGLRRLKQTPLNHQVLQAVAMAGSNYQRHQTVEDFLLNCDRNTIATEVPVYYQDRHLGLIAGHIDVLQINYGKVHILDYKPAAAKENPGKVATQLTLYAIALAVRAGLHLHQIRCGYFDEHDVYLFDPRKPARKDINTFSCEGGAPESQCQAQELR